MFLSKREGKDATGNVPVERKTEIFITFAQRQNGNLMCHLFGKMRMYLNVGDSD